MSNARLRLLELFKARAFKTGKFTLASGRESSYYIDSKKILFNGEAAYLLGNLLYDATRSMDIGAVGGLEIGAIPLTTAIVVRYEESCVDIEGFFVRKQPKGHGSQELIEGVLPPGSRVAIVDDVLTTGASALQAIRAVEAAGATVAAVVCVVDRLDGASTLLAKYDFRSLFTIRDFGVDPPE